MLADYIHSDRGSKSDQVVLQLSEPEARQILLILHHAELLLKISKKYNIVQHQVLSNLIDAIQLVLKENEIED